MNIVTKISFHFYPLVSLRLKLREICVTCPEPSRTDPWSMNYLCAYKAPYKAPLQLSRILYKSALFMQNEPNFRKVKLNVNNVLTRDYERMDTWSIGKNEPKTNPNEPNFKKAKMNANSLLTKAYENQPLRSGPENKPNQTQSHNPVTPKGAASNKCAGNPGRMGRYSTHSAIFRIQPCVLSAHLLRRSLHNTRVGCRRRSARGAMRHWQLRPLPCGTRTHRSWPFPAACVFQARRWADRSARL